MKQVVRYAVKYEEFTVTDAEFQLVQSLYEVDRKVTAIKFIRQQYNLGLKEAKDICDGIAVAIVGVHTYTIDPSNY